MMLRSAALGLLCLLLGGCELFTGEFQYGSVRVLAEDRAGAPVVGVEAELYRPDHIVALVRTGVDGSAVINSVAARTFSLRIRVPQPYFLVESSDSVFEQRRDTVLTVTVEQGVQTEVRVRVRVACCGTLRLRAADSTGAALPGARAVLFDRGLALDSATTGAAGTLAFSNIPDGIFALRVRAPAGYAFRSGADSTFNVRIRQGAETSVSVVIRRAPAPTPPTTPGTSVGRAVVGTGTTGMVGERRRGAGRLEGGGG